MTDRERIEGMAVDLVRAWIKHGGDGEARDVPAYRVMELLILDALPKLRCESPFPMNVDRYVVAIEYDSHIEPHVVVT